MRATVGRQHGKRVPRKSRRPYCAENTLLGRPTVYRSNGGAHQPSTLFSSPSPILVGATTPSPALSVALTDRQTFCPLPSPAPVGATIGRPLSPLAQKAHTASGISAAEKAFAKRRGKTVFENKERRGLPEEKSPPARSFLTCFVSDTARGENRPRYGGRCLVGHPCVHRCGRRTRYRCRARYDTARRGRDPPLPL